MREEASRETPGANTASDLLHFFAAVDVHEVDGKLHEESMDGAAGHDPESSSARKAGTPEQALVASGGSIGDFQAGCDFCAASEVLNLQKGGGFRLVLGSDAAQSSGLDSELVPIIAMTFQANCAFREVA